MWYHKCIKIESEISQMDKKILFMSFNKKTGTISGAAVEDLTVIDGSEFATALNIKLPQAELDRFEKENDLQFNNEYQIYNFGGENPAILFTNCKFVSRDSYGVYTYTADTWKWI